MTLGFLIGLFFVGCIRELMQWAGFDLPPLAPVLTVSAALCGSALWILGSDSVGTIRTSWQRRGSALPSWSWQRSFALLAVVPGLWMISIACVLAFTSFVLVPPRPETAAAALAVQILAIALAQELFFREAVLKIFGSDRGTAFAVTCAASALFHLTHGLPAAVMAGGAALAFMALRMAGMNILLVAAVHGATAVLFGRILVAQLDVHQVWPYAIAFASSQALFAAVLMRMGRRGTAMRALATG